MTAHNLGDGGRIPVRISTDNKEMIDKEVKKRCDMFLLLNDAVSSSHIISHRSEAQVIVNSNYAGSVGKDKEVDSCSLERLKRITRKLSQDCCGNLCENKESRQ